MLYSVPSILISDPATLHAFPFRFSDPGKWGWMVCLGVCWLVLCWFQGFFRFPCPFFSMERHWIPWTPWSIGVKECSAQGFALVLYLDIFGHTPSQPFPFSCFPKAQDLWGGTLCVINSAGACGGKEGISSGSSSNMDKPLWVSGDQQRLEQMAKVWNGRWPAGLVSVWGVYSCHPLYNELIVGKQPVFSELG